MEIIVKIFNFIFQAIAWILNLILSGLESAVGVKSTKKQGYNASFGSSSGVLSAYNKGFCVNGTQSITRKQSYQGFLVNGVTGTYKTVSTIIPSVLRMDDCSMIIFAPSPELFNTLSGPLASKGVDVQLFNLSDASSSLSYNHLAYLKNSAQTHKAASTFVKHGNGKKSGGDPFWEHSGISLIANTISVLRECAPPEFQNLSNVRHLISSMVGNPEGVEDVFIPASESTYSEYRAFQGNSENTKASIIATARAALNLMQDENISRITASDSLQIDQLRKKKTALFLTCNLIDLEYAKPIFSLLIENLFEHLLTKLPDAADKDVFFFFDELGSISIPSLPLFLANCRKYRIGVMGALQDAESQLTENYGRQGFQTIMANTYTKLFLTSGISKQSGDHLEGVLGRKTIETEGGRKETVPLMTSDELRMLAPSKGILIAGHNKPLLLKVTPFFKNFRFKKYRTIPPVEIQGSALDTEIELLPLTRKLKKAV